MFRDTLYTVRSIDQQEGAVNATLAIHKEHPLFAGHFPGQPVLPGACMLQILKEILEDALALSLMLRKADQIKFLAIVDPVVDDVLQLTLSHKSTENGTFNVTATVTGTSGVCFKFKGSFTTRSMDV